MRGSSCFERSVAKRARHSSPCDEVQAPSLGTREFCARHERFLADIQFLFIALGIQVHK